MSLVSILMYMALYNVAPSVRSHIYKNLYFQWEKYFFKIRRNSIPLSILFSSVAENVSFPKNRQMNYLGSKRNLDFFCKLSCLT